MSRRGNQGVALIIAIAVLAALLLLALPFLFSQTASIAGARASAWDGTARRGQGRASGLATAAAVYATGLVRTPSLLQSTSALFAYTQIPAQVWHDVGLPSYGETSWRAIVETGAPWMNGAAQVAPALDTPLVSHGAIIEDESRRIDPNCLTERAWAVVLEKAGIRDPYTIWWSWTPGPGGGVNAAYGQWTMADHGRLARALTWWRPAQSHRYNRLEDLLGADPNAVVSASGRTLGCTWFGPKGYDKVTGQAIWPITEAQVEASRNPQESDKVNVKTDGDPDHVGYRVAPLTQSELDRLRPLLSFLIPGQGLGGQVDYATVVDTAATSFTNYAGYVDDVLDPGSLGSGPSLRPNNLWTHRSDGTSQRYLNNSWLGRNDILALEVPPVLNINTVPSTSTITKLYDPVSPATGIGWPKLPTDTPVRTLADLPRLRMLDPRSGDGTTMFERPPLGVASFGIVAIEGIADSLDPQGRIAAQRRVRTVVQAVPQERPAEAVWATQADLEALLRVRQGSWVVAGPHPTNRIKDWGGRAPATAGAPSPDMQALAAAGWVEPAPLCSFGINPAVSFDWWLPLGLTGPQDWDKVQQAFTTSPTAANAVPNQAPALGIDLAALQPSGTAPGRLTAQGLHLQAGDQYAYKVGPAKTPLVMDVNGSELHARHISLRFCLPDGASGLVPLLEARASEPGRDSDSGVHPVPAGFGTPDKHTDDQSVWRVHYDAANQMLVLVMANAALPWYETEDRQRFGVQAWTTGTDAPAAAYDARCEPGALAFAPAWQAQRVEFRYHVQNGLQQGRWYQLQAWCASDRPGYHGLALDGIVGRDAIETGTFDRTGDHYTWPSLRLKTALTGAVNTAAAVTGNSHLALASLEVKTPPKPGGGLYLVEEVLPPRGVIRIDDEFLSYDAAAGTQLTGLQRARRVRTNQAATFIDANNNGAQDAGETVLDWQRFPLTQDHAAGTLVTPGWSQVDLQFAPFDGSTPARAAATIANGRWLRGAALLVGPTADPASALTHLPPLARFNTGSLGTGTPPGSLIQPTTIAISPKASPDGQTWPWADRGYVEFRHVGGPSEASAYFEYAGGSLALSDWSGGGIPDSTASAEMEAVQISIRVDSPVADVPAVPPAAFKARFADAGGLQLLDPATGRCEWIRYTRRIDKAGSDGAAGHYFLADQGGFYRDPAGSPLPRSDRRGAMRTPWRTIADKAWPDGTLVLPVQNKFINSNRLESGDVVTVVAHDILNGGSRRPPVQLLVRHAARDGYPATTAAAGEQWAVYGRWFALTHQVPDALGDPQDQTGAQTMLIGRGWGGDDLSMYANAPSRRGQLPRRDAMADAADSTGVRLFIGCPAPNSPCPAASVIVDDLCAGSLRGPADANPAANLAITGFADPATGTAATAITAAPGALPVVAVANASLFTGPYYGLVAIDGEVFAYRRGSDDRHAVLIARGLLDSTAMAHALSGTVTVPSSDAAPPDRTVAPGLPVAVLPLGPVAELCSALSPADQGKGVDIVEVPFADYYKDPATFANPHQDSYAGDPQSIMRPPFVLIHDPTGAAGASPAEAMRLLGRPLSNQRTTAPWLRGLYATAAGTWTASYTPAAHPAGWTPPPGPAAATVSPQGPGSLNPVVIGWWPRFAPGLSAGGASLPTDQRSAQLRSRSFAWAGFALRMRGMRQDPNIAVLDGTLDSAAKETTTGIADVTVASDGGCSVKARALAPGEASTEMSDWAAMPASAVAILGAANPGLTAPFAWSRFLKRELDGSELRIHWEYAGTGTGLQAAAAAQGCAPRLGAADSAAQAPPASGASVVRLRCVAPTRILAIEEVR